MAWHGEVRPGEVGSGAARLGEVGFRHYTF